ncbi:hypothetical protein HYV86_02705 [Candidatus Woesearchaeota archaeon]|nr:hypothetical protein [Candidatus Woesearchaeota archaeon]
MTSVIEYATQGSRIFLSGLKNRIVAKKYEGNAQEICHQVVKECWNGRYFQTSTTNFPQFWTRDFGWCTASLLQLGYKNEVHHTLRYALNHFQQSGEITTTITPGGKPFDFPFFAVDSLPWLIHSMRISKFNYDAYKVFLNRQIGLYHEKVINKNTGLVKADVYFSSMKDFALRKSSCYDNCMVATLARDLSELPGLINPFANIDSAALLIKHFWNGSYFYDDLRQKPYVGGDANIFPFITGTINDEEIAQKCIKAIEEAKLDHPFPLRYTSTREAAHFVWQEVFLRGYERTAIWTHMGPLYIKFLKQLNPENQEKADLLKQLYTAQIEKHKNYLEVFSEDAKPFSTPFYYSDRGMLWAANYLTL